MDAERLNVGLSFDEHHQKNERERRHQTDLRNFDHARGATTIIAGASSLEARLDARTKRRRHLFVGEKRWHLVEKIRGVTVCDRSARANAHA